jgi:maltoporin
MKRIATCFAAAALAFSAAQSEALAALPDGRVDFSMYGRMGVAWALNGQLIQGKTMNLTTERSIGGRFEEGDYLEPTLTFHVMKVDKEKPNDPYVDVVMTPAMFARNGSFLGFFSNPSEALRIELFQMYVEAGNVFTPGLKLWIGARFYRGTDVHAADYFYFNDLSGQGAGLKYKGLDLAVLVRSAIGDAQYSFDSTATNADTTLDVNRVRTIFVAQYVHKFGPKTSSIQGIAEAHVLPAGKKGGGPELSPLDYGLVAGVKLHLDFGAGNFNDASVRYGTRIANGGWGGSRTYQTFGPADLDGHYSGAYGLEVVEHFLVNFGTIASLNGYGVLDVSKSALAAADIKPADAVAGVVDRTLNWAAGLRGFLYAHKNFHMIAETSIQGRKDGDRPMGTAVKLSLVPTVVPTGDSTAWGRPHLRAVYTAGFYNQAASDQLQSPYLRTVGPTRVAHYLGAKTEWWF